MKAKITSLILTLFYLTSLEAATYSHHFDGNEICNKVWKESDVPPFTELLLTWNASRPREGKFLFYVSLKTTKWSEWFLYSTWGDDGQTSYCTTSKDSSVKVYQDAVETLNGEKPTGFRIKAVPAGFATLDQIHALHVYINGDKLPCDESPLSDVSPIALDIRGISQMKLNHPRHRDLCSPTATAAVSGFLSGRDIDPVRFAEQSFDAGFDIYGNWVFNVAQASVELGREWDCRTERLNGFKDIYERLLQNTPVIVSVRGPLPGSALPYSQGHLIAVTGYDPVTRRVFCMDSAFPTDAETSVSYDLFDFIRAWNRRGNIAYTFIRKSAGPAGK